MQHLAAERVVLDVLDEREALGARVLFHGQIHQHVFRGGMVDEFRKVVINHFKVLRFDLAAINGRGHTAGAAEFRDFGALDLRTRIGF